MILRSLKWVIAAALVFMLGILVIPKSGNEQNQRQDRATLFETNQKQALVNQDVNLTERLCRVHCRSDIKKTAMMLSGSSEKTAAMRLAEVRREHPHMISLTWHSPDHNKIHSGQIPTSLRDGLAKYLNEADRSLHENQTYESPRIHIDGEHYMVLSAPGTDGSGMTGVVRQTLLNQVNEHQRKNLRLVPYPPEGNYNIESVDSDTHRDIHVDHGEENAGVSHYHKQQVVVKFTSPPSTEHIQKIKQALQITFLKKLGYTYLFESEKQTAEKMLSYFRSRRDVDYAEPHYLYMTNETAQLAPSGNNDNNDQPNKLLVPNDYLFADYQWNLPITETIPGWNISKGNDQIIIAVIDTGVDEKHPDLKGRLAPGKNIVNPDQPPLDDVGHGTHVAGVISASVNNSEGVAGMTWYDRVMPIKVLDETGAGSTYSVAEGIIWAVDHGAKVINMSLGNYAEAQFLHEAIRYAFDHDVVMIAATGNDNTDEPGFPAAYEEVLAVSATDERRQRAAFSNYGNYVDVVAPGVSIASTYPHNQYAALSGTSMATPHVSALAGLVRSVNPLLKNTEVMDIIRHTAIDLGAPGRDPQFGYGQIDVAAALERAERMKTSVKFLPEWLRREIQQLRSEFGLK